MKSHPLVKYVVLVVVFLLSWTGVTIGQVIRTEDHLLEPRGQLANWERYGSNVALYRDRAAVASSNDSTLAQSAGSVTIYLRRTSGWELHQKLFPSDFAPNNQPTSGPFSEFGRGLVMHEDWLFVGAPRHSLPSLNNGAVYVYRWNGARYDFFQKVQAPTPGFLGEFGSGLALLGDRLYIGAPTDHEGGSFFGAVYTYAWNGAAWLFVAKDTNLTIEYHNFGYTLAGDAGQLAVTSVNRVGIMQINANGTLTRLQTLAPTAGITDYGLDLAMHSGVLVVGHARFGGFPDVYNGRAYVYRQQGNGTFALETILSGDGLTHPSAGNAFGGAIAIADGTIVVGSSGAYDPVSGEVPGRAFVFEYNGSMWVQVERLNATFCCAGLSIGWSAAINDGTILVGAPTYRVNGLIVGAALIYERPFGTMICDGQPTSSGGGARLELFGVPVATANALTLRASGQPGPGLAVFLAGSVNAPGTVLGEGVLCLAGAQRLGVSPINTNGSSEFQVSLGAVGVSGIQPGDTFAFQSWFRDANPTATVNLSDAVAVTFH